MERLWNYMFYLNWRMLNKIGFHLVQKPILTLLIFFFPKLKKKKDEIEYGAYNAIANHDYGYNLMSAIGSVFTVTVIIYATFCLYITVLMNVTIRENVGYFIILVMSLSYLTNYLLLWRKDLYKKYFEQFDTALIKKIHYFYLCAFYLSICGFFILSLFWFVGFNI